MRRRVFLGLSAAYAVAGCTAQSVWAPEEQVQAARYVHPGPKSLTLFTVISNRSNGGAHSGLLINASQRVMFDPAGTWYHPKLPERNDVHFGMTDRMVAFYIDYHARETYRVVEQTVEVSPGVAEIALQRALSYGPVPKAMCANSVADILRGVPGFERVGSTWFPKRIMELFGELPGVRTRVITDDDADNNHGVLLVQAGDPRLDPAN